MMPSLFAGVTGLKSHQTKMDVIGNNIANVNTVGFKKSTVEFQDILSQNLQSATASTTGGRGGTNPIQVGLGTEIGSIDTLFTKGAPQITGRDADLSIDGEGMFMVSDGNETYYTRAGNFGLDGKGYLTASNGMKVQGWAATKKSDGTTEIGQDAPITDLNIKIGEVLPAKATTKVAYSGNLNASGGLTNLRLNVDADGNAPGTARVDVDIKFSYNVEEDKWEWKASGPAGSNIAGDGYFKLDADGSIIQAVQNNRIASPTSIALVEPPTAGLITFKEKNNLTNSTTSKFVSNEVVTSNQVYNSLGNQHTLSLNYTKIDENIWKWNASEGKALTVDNGEGFLTFDAYGQKAGNHVFAKLDYTTNRLAEITNPDPSKPNLASAPAQSELGVTWDPTDMTQYYYPDGNGPTAAPTGQADSPYSIDKNGVVRYRGHVNSTDPVGTIPLVDKDGNTIQAIVPGTKGLPREGEVMNASFSGTLSFDPASMGGALPPDKGADRVIIMPDFNNVTQFTAQYGIKFSEQNGYNMGELENFKLNDKGDIMGEYSNGYKQILGRIGISKFFNPSGLEKMGGNTFRKTSNSGDPQIGIPGTGGIGKITGGSLEMSNVDLAQEFTDMIIAQRGFQANSKTISTADQLLQELINLKR